MLQSLRLMIQSPTPHIHFPISSPANIRITIGSICSIMFIGLNMSCTISFTVYIYVHISSIYHLKFGCLIKFKMIVSSPIKKHIKTSISTGFSHVFPMFFVSFIAFSIRGLNGSLALQQ